MKLWGNLYFIFNSIFLISLTILISFQIIRNIKLRENINENVKNFDSSYNRIKLLKEIKTQKLPGSYVKVNIVEKIEINLIEKSNIKNYIPFANFYALIVCSFIIFIVSFQAIYKIMLFIPSTIILCTLLSAIPMFILDTMAKYNAEKVRKKLASFISVLNRWCAVREDIFYAFEKSIESGIGEPLKTYIRDMIVQVNRGVEPLEALSMLQLKVDNPQFRDFIINIKQNVKHRGDIRKLLGNLEEQFFKIEEEFNRRKISTYKDRITIYFIMFLVIAVGYTFLKINIQVEEFYLTTSLGKLLLTIFCLLYSLGFYLTLKVSKFDL